MNINELKEWFTVNELNYNTVSFYVDDCGTAYTDCDITGDVCTTANCRCLTNEGDIYYFNASEALIGGALGKLTGAF